MAEPKWYNSSIANKVGTAVLIVGIGFGSATFVRGCSEVDPKTLETKAKYELKLQVADLNGNGIPEKFYAIDGKIALVELDGKPVSELYKK